VVVAEKPVQHTRVARGEVAVHARGCHPGVQRPRGDPVRRDRLFLERALLVVGPRPQPLAELADLHRPQLLAGHPGGGRGVAGEGWHPGRAGEGSDGSGDLRGEPEAERALVMADPSLGELRTLCGPQAMYTRPGC
jgi:hypothetical protein